MFKIINDRGLRGRRIPTAQVRRQCHRLNCSSASTAATAHWSGRAHRSLPDGSAQESCSSNLQPLATGFEEHLAMANQGSGGEQSRWNAGKDLSLFRSGPRRVVEVRYDHMEGDRFRHTAQFNRWRPDRDPRSCTYAHCPNQPIRRPRSAMSALRKPVRRQPTRCRQTLPWCSGDDHRYLGRADPHCRPNPACPGKPPRPWLPRTNSCASPPFPRIGPPAVGHHDLVHGHVGIAFAVARQPLASTSSSASLMLRHSIGAQLALANSIGPISLQACRATRATPPRRDASSNAIAVAKLRMWATRRPHHHRSLRRGVLQHGSPHRAVRVMHQPGTHRPEQRARDTTPSATHHHHLGALGHVHQVRHDRSQDHLAGDLGCDPGRCRRRSAGLCRGSPAPRTAATARIPRGRHLPPRPADRCDRGEAR